MKPRINDCEAIEEMSRYDPNYVPQKSFALVGQKAIILNSENKILVLRRSNKLGAAGMWSLPGGALEYGEDPCKSIQREIDEETKLSAVNVKPFHIKSSLDQDENFVVIIGYVCNTNLEAVKLNWEHDDYKWLTKEKALDLDLTPDGREFIKNFKI